VKELGVGEFGWKGWSWGVGGKENEDGLMWFAAG
jgi:hypothetical protein